MPLNRDPPKRRARWLGIAAVATAFIAYRAYVIRHSAAPTTVEAPPASPPSAAASASAAPAAHLLLDPAVRRKMRLAPRQGATFTLAFGKGRLGQLTQDGLTVRDGATGRVKLTLALEKPRAVAALADGSLFCVGEARTLRLLWHDDKPRVYPLIPI